MTFTPDQNPKIKAAFYNENGEIKTTFCPGEKVTIKVGLANGEYFLDKAQRKNETYKNHSVTYYSNYSKIPAINFNNIVHNSTVPLNATMAPFAGETEPYHLLDDQFSFIAPETPGTYTIKVTDKVTQSYSCPKDTNIVFTIAARPSVSLVAIRGNVDPTDPNHVYICEGDSAILQANSTTSNCVYNWYATQTGDKIANLKYDKDTVKVATTRLVKIVDGQGCESDFSNEIIVDIASSPSILIDKESEFVCPNTPATVDINASGANNWQFFITNAEHTEYSRLGNGETTNSKYSMSKTIKDNEFVNQNDAAKPRIYTGYVGVENREAGSISYGCKNFAEFTFKEAKTPVVQLKALKKVSENSYTEISAPCEGDEYYVQVVDASASEHSEATLKATLVLKGVDGAADEEVSLNTNLISVSSFTADKRKRFSVIGYNKYDDGTSCPSDEVILDVKVNKIPTFSLNATAACEKTKNSYSNNDGGNYGAGNGKTTFSVSNLVLDKVSNTANKVTSYTWEIQGSQITNNKSSYEHTYLSDETEAIARVIITDANGCSSIPVEKTSPLMKRPRQIVAAEAKCIGDNQVKITNTMDPTCGFSANDVDFWYRLYNANPNLTEANGAYTDTVKYLRTNGLTGWLQSGNNSSKTPYTKLIADFSGWRNAYPEHTFNTTVTGPMWACTRMRSVKSDNICESEVECVLVQPSEKPTFTTVMKSGGYALNTVNNTAEVCPSTPVVIDVNVTKFAAGCPEATITVKEANASGNVIETKTVTSASGIQTISLGDVTGNLDFIVEVSSSCGCLASDRYRINVLPTPTVSLVAEGSRIEDGYIYVCPNGTADLKAIASSSVDITNYKWYENNSLNNSTSDILSGQGAGSYYVSVVDQNGCESSPSNTIVIEEVAVPTVSATAPEVVCEKTPFEINIDNPVDGITYVVYNPADDGTASQTSARATIKKIETMSSISVAIPSTYSFKSAADVFTVVAKNDRGCVSDPYEVKVEKAEKPQMTILARKYGNNNEAYVPNLSVCPNDMVEFSLTNGATLYKEYTYTMTPSNSDVNVYGTNTERPTAQMLDNRTVFTFSFESEAGCVSQGTYTVNVVSPKTLRITDNVLNRYDNKPIVCPGGQTPVTLTATNGIYVNWSNAGLPSATSAIMNENHDPNVAASITFNPSVAQTYVFNGTDVNGCAVSASYDILIANLVNMENIAVTLQPDDTPVTDLAVCENSTITLTASGSISNAKDGETIKNYDWFADEALTEPIGSGVSISDFMTIADDSRNAEGFYADIQDVKNYWVRATSNFGCVSGKMKTTVTIDRTPEIKFKNSSEPCIDTQIEIIPNTGSSNQYFTITNLTSGVVYENVLTAPFVPEKAGQSYNFKVEAQRGACKAVEYTSINAKPLPIIKLFDAETGLSFMDACPDVDNAVSEHYLKFTVDGGKVVDVPTITGASLASATNTFTFGNNTYDGNETDAYYAKYSRPTALNSSIKVTAKGSNGCETTVAFPITIKPTPNKPEVTVLRNGVPTSDNEFCDGDKVTVIAKSTNDNDKTVSFNNGGAYGNKNGAVFDSQSGTAVFEFDAVSNSVSTDQTINVSATNDDNCNSSKESVTITVSDKLDLKINNEPAGSTVKACVGTKELLNVTAGGTLVNPADYSIEWFASDKSTSLSTEASYEVEPDPVYSKTIWVKVKSKDALGCEEWTNITISPVAVPSITIVAENSNTGKRVTSTSAESDSIVYCSGDASGLNISAIVPDGVTYKWDNEAENTDLVNKGGWTSTQTNVLTVTYRTESGLVCETKREFKTVVKEKPTVGVDAAAPDFITSVDVNGVVTTNPALCVGSKITLNPKFSDDVVSYLWHNGATTPSLTYTVPDGVYNYSVKATTTDGCSASALGTVTPVYVRYDLETVYACYGTSAEIKPITGQNLQFTYYDETGSNLLGNGNSYLIPQVNQSMRYLVVGSKDGCDVSKKVYVQALTNPALKVSEDVEVCKGANAALSVSSPASGTKYYWGGIGSNEGSTYTATNILDKAVIPVYAVKDYSSTYSTAPACTTSKVVTVTPIETPNFQVSSSAERLCADGKMSFTINDASANNTYSWKVYEYDNATSTRGSEIAGQGQILAADKEFVTNGVTTSTGWIEVVAEGSSTNGCLTTASKKMQFAPKATLALVSVDGMPVSGDVNVCSNTETKLEFTSGYNSYVFNDIPLASNVYTYNEIVNSNTSRSYIVTAKDQYGCPTTTATVDVNINVAPQVIAQDMVSVCDGALADVQVSSDKQLHWYYANSKNPTSWNDVVDAAGDPIVANVAVIHNIDEENAGSYILVKGEYPDFKGACSTVKQISLNVINKPDVELSSTGSVCPSEPFNLSTKAEAGVAGADYYAKNWFTVDKDNSGNYINFNPTATSNQILSSGERYYALVASSNELATCRDTFYIKYTAVNVPPFTDKIIDDNLIDNNGDPIPFQKRFCLGDDGIVLKVDNASTINWNEVRWYAGLNANGEMITEAGSPVYGDHITVAPRATSNYYVEGTGENGCKVSALFTVKVNEAPNYVLSSSALNGKVCSGSDLVVNAVNLNSAVPGTKFSWNNANVSTDSHLEIPQVTGPTEVRLVVSTDNGCTQELKATYGVIDAPTFKVDVPKNVCVNGDIIATASVDGSVDPSDYIYSWSVDENMASDVRYGQTYTFDNVVANDGANGFKFYATVKDRNYGCTSEIEETSVNVVTPGAPVINYVDKVCEGEPTEIELTGTSKGSDLTGYTFWVKTPEMSEFINEASMKHATGPITSARRYEYYVQLTQGEAVCKSSSSSIVINVESKPNIQVQEYGSPCSNQELTLRASAYGVDSVGIKWEANTIVGPNLTFTNEQGILKVTENSQNVTANKNFTQKQFKGNSSTDVILTCSQTLNYKYKTYPLPLINVTENKDKSSHCPGSSVYFDAEALTENLKSITWSGNGVFAFQSAGDTISSQHVYVTVPKDENIPVDANGEKILHTQLYYTVSNDRCTNTGSVDVTYDTTPGFKLLQIEPIASEYGHNKNGIFGSTLKFCENSKVVLEAISESTDGSQFTWRGGSVETGSRNEYDQPGSYEVSVVNDKGCTSSMIFTIEMELLPSLSTGIKGVNAKNNYCYVEGNDNGLVVDVATSDNAKCYVSLEAPDVPDANATGWKAKNNRLECNPEKGSWVYAYAMSNSDLQCVNKSQKWVEVHKSPVVGITGDKVACSGSALNLIATYNSPEQVPAVNYTWIGEGISGMTGDNIYAEGMSAGTKTISVVVTDENQCQGVDTVEVKILNKPNIGLSVDGAQPVRRLRQLTFCDGESKTVVPQCLDCDPQYQMNDFGWAYGESSEDMEMILDANGNPTQNVTVSKRGSYTVYGSLVDADGNQLCEASVGFIATPIDKPVINVTGNTTICANDMIVLEGANITDYVYTWSGNTVVGYVGNKFECEPSANGTTTVSLMVKDESTSCTNSTTFEVNTISAPSPNVTVPEIVCENGSSEFVIKDYLDDNNNPKYTNIKWTVWNNGQTESLPQTAEGTPKFNLQMTDKPLVVRLDLKSSDMQYPCASTITYPVEVQKHQELEYQGDPVACQNSDVTLEVSKAGTDHIKPDANVSGQNNPYTWYLPNGEEVKTATNQYTFHPDASGNYMVDIESGVCVDRLQFRLEVKSAPQAYPSYDKAVCSGGSTTLNVTPNNESGSMTYVWSNVDPDDPSKTVTTTIPTYTVSPKGEKTIYSVVITSDATKCSSFYEMPVEVRPSPIIIVDKTLGELEPCANSYGEAVADGAVKYQWYDITDPANEQLIGYGTSRKVYVANTPVKVKVVGYDSIGCESSNPIEAVLTPTPDPDFTVSGSTAAICAGQSITLNAKATDPSVLYQYSWYDPIRDLTIDAAELTNYTLEKTTQFEVTATSVTKHGTRCSVKKAFLQQVDQLPELTIYGTQNVCDGIEYTFTATGAETYVWQHNDNNNEASFTTSFKYDAGDKAPVVVVGSNGKCSSTPTTYYVNVRRSPDLTLTGDEVVCGNNQATITASSTVPNVTFYWPTESISSNTIKPIVQPAYQVFDCIATDPYGCTTTESFKVDVVAAPKLMLNVNYEDSPLVGGNIPYDSTSSKFNVPFCDGDSISLRLSGASTFEWITFDNVDTLSTTDSYKVRPNGPLTFKAIGHLSGCQSEVDLKLEMNQKPTLFLLSDTIPCRGEAQDMVVAASGYGTLLYNWSMKEHNNRGFVENADTLHDVIAERPIEDSLNNIYSVAVKIQESGCTTTKEFHYGYVKSPEFQVDGERAACVGSSLSLKAVPDNEEDKYSYTWTSEDGLINRTGDSISYTFRVSGKQPKIKVSAYDGGCRVYQDVDLTGWESPALKAFALGKDVDGQVVVCENVPFNISIMDTATAMIKNWWIKGKDTVSNTSAVHVIANEAETYLGYARNTNGCESVIAVPVVVEYAPIATNRMGGDTTSICKLDTAVFDLQAVNVAEYSWDDAERTVGNVLKVSPAVTTRYLVNVKGTNGCERGQYFTVSVNNLPSVQFNTIGGVKGDNEAACLGSDYKLVVSPRISGDYSYMWDTKSGLDTLYLRANDMDSEKHVVNITDRVTGCKSKDSITIRTQALPEITVAGVTAVCRGEHMVLNAGGAANYYWMRGTDTLAKSATLQIDEVTSAGIYTAYGDDRGCVGKTEVPVTVRETPNVYLNSASSGVIDGNTVSLCDGTNNLELEVASSFVGGVDNSDLKYTWMNLSNEDRAVDQTLTIPSVSQNKDYMVKVSRISAPEACPGNITVSVRVLNTPRIYIKGDRNVCDNDYAELIPYGDFEDSFDNYVWKDNNGNSYGMEDTLKVLVTDTVTYTVTGYNTHTGCSNSISHTVNKINAPEVSLDIRGQQGTYVCSGKQFVVQAHGAFSYLWMRGKDTLSTQDAYGDTAKTQTTYYVEGFDANGCKNNATITVDVRPTPVIWTDGNKPICLGESLDLEAKGAQKYNWTMGDVSGENNQFMTSKPKYSTTIFLTGYDEYGCSASEPIEITVRDTPMVFIDCPNTYVCEGDIATLTATGAVNYQWTKGVQSLSDVVTQMITEDQTLFEVVGTDINGCTSTARRVVKMQAAPVLTVTGDSIICEGDKLSLNVAGVGAKTFEWGDGSVGNKFIDKPKHDTIYFVSGTSLYGCTSTKSIPVIVNPLPSISIYGNDNICQGDSTTLYVLGAKSYVWSSGDKVDTITVKPRKNAVYQVTGTDENGCQAMEKININVFDMYVQSSAGIV